MNSTGVSIALGRRSRIAGVALFIGWFGFAAPTAAQSSIATPDDYRQEKTIISALNSPQSDAALSAVREARGKSGLVSTLSESNLDLLLAKLLRWVVRDYADSGSLRLLSDAPEGKNGKGASNSRLVALQRTYWLQNNALYGAQALLDYEPPLGRILSGSWRTKWQQYFPQFCPDTESGVVVGRLPAYENSSSTTDARCRFPKPGVWQFFVMIQHPSPNDPGFDTLPKPLIGTDYPGDANGPARLETISRTSARDLLKYGCLRQALVGNIGVARQMFDLALAQWDGDGFVDAKNGAGGKLAGIYYSRDIAFALLCANAAGEGGQESWGNQHPVSKSAIERRLWGSQSPTGGIWTNYCGASAAARCTGNIPPMAKQTNEIAPLVLLAYGPNIWKPKR
jgi:hypothetical protein